MPTYYSRLREEQIKESLKGEMEWILYCLAEIEEQFPFLQLVVHAYFDEEKNAEFLKKNCTYSTNIEFKK